MKTLLIFAAAIYCVQAVNLPFLLSGSFESSEEEISVLLRADRQILSSVGVITQPLVQAVKLKVPRYLSPTTKQLFINEALAARGIIP